MISLAHLNMRNKLIKHKGLLIVLLVLWLPVQSIAMGSELIDSASHEKKTVSSKLKKQRSVSVKDFGAIGDGVVDDTVAFNNAISASKKVFVPNGIYILKNVALRQGTVLFGKGWGSVLKQKPAASDGDFVLAANRLDGGGTSVSENMKNIVIRDLQIEGPDVLPIFVEHCHLVFLSAVSDVLIKNVFFKGFKGDGLYMGSGDSGSAERHNQRVAIRKSRFDGVNNQNRNGISAIDVDGLVVEDSTFINISNGKMPGAIDIEPNDHTYHIVQNISIRNNKFSNIGGLAAISMYIPQSVIYGVNNIQVEGNYIDSPASAFFGLYSKQAHHNMKIVVRANTIKSAKSPFRFISGDGILVTDNIVLSASQSAVLGNKAGVEKTSNVSFVRNKFVNCGFSSGVCLTVYSVDHFDLLENIFENNGTGKKGFATAVLFSTGESSYVRFIDNKFSFSSGEELAIIQRDSKHIFSASTSKFSGNRLNGLATSWDSLMAQ